MSKYIFYAKLTAEIELSNEELNLLIECSERHYDSTVKSISMCGKGGFLYGLHNRRKWEIESNTEISNGEFKSNQIQLMLKSLEFKNEPEAGNLYGKLITIAKEMQTKNITLNKTLREEVMEYKNPFSVK